MLLPNQIARAWQAAAGAAAAAALLCAAGCDPLLCLSELTATNPPAARALAAAAPAQAPAAAVESILAFARADLIELVARGATATVHLADIVAPSPQTNSAFNADLAQQYQLDSLAMARYGNMALRAAAALTKDRALQLVIYASELNQARHAHIEGDIVFADKSTLAGQLLSAGCALLTTNMGLNAARLVGYESEARLAERGLWRHPVPLANRFDADSEFHVRTLNVDRTKVYADGQQGQYIKESHREFNRVAEISLRLTTRKPLLRTYAGTLKYRFHVRQAKGERVQQITAAPLQGALQSALTGKRAPLSAADQRAQQDVAEAVRDYNRDVHGQKVSEQYTSDMTSMPFALVSLETNIVISSPSYSYSENTKGGVSYDQGDMYLGYDLEIWIGTNLVYTHYR